MYACTIPSLISQKPSVVGKRGVDSIPPHGPFSVKVLRELSIRPGLPSVVDLQYIDQEKLLIRKNMCLMIAKESALPSER